MRPKWYSPQLSREIVGRLYVRAKENGIRMTVLANTIMQKGLDADEVVQCRQDMDTDSRMIDQTSGSPIKLKAGSYTRS